MQRKIFTHFLTTIFSIFIVPAFGQNVGIHTATPLGKLHVKGSDNTSQLIIDADTIQGNTNPLIKLRNSSGTDLIWIHSDDSTNTFIGLKAGKVNVIDPQGINNTFVGSRAGSSNTNGRDNTTIGTNALFSNTKASWNTAVGTNALYTQSFSPPAGAWWQSSNVAVGYEAMYSNQPTNSTNGINNTAIGTFALRTNSIGYQNTAVGKSALHNNTDGSQNTATGFNALYTNAWGNQNTAMGNNVLFSNIGGDFNTATGQGALYSNTHGSHNTATGQAVLYSNIEGISNTATGQGALYLNTYGNFNNAFGQSALSYNTTGSYNSALGSYALFANTTGHDNTAIGNSSLNSNTTGYENYAGGKGALYYNTTGYRNTANGVEALHNNTEGDYNTAFGYQALYSSAATWNTAIGFQALYGNTNGNSNTASGLDALSNNTTGSENTANGLSALFYLVGGNGNAAYGAYAGTAPGSPNVSNTISFGNHNYLNAASNQAFIGNLSTAWIGGQVTWSTYSDARVKNNVAEDVKGLEFITRLRPVTYYRSIKAMSAITGNTEAKDYPEKYDIEKIKFSGFLAQDVEIAARAAGYDFSGITVPKNSQELYTLSYEQFVVPLVKAVQELNTALTAEVADLKSGAENMKSDIKALKAINDSLLQRLEKVESSLEK